MANAEITWTQTGTGKDLSEDANGAIVTQYVVTESIRPLRGNQRSAFVKTVYSPEILLGDGRYAASEIGDVSVNCRDFSWGVASSMIFDRNMIPLLTNVGVWVPTKPIWTLKDMAPVDPRSTTYKTAKFICATNVVEPWR